MRSARILAATLGALLAIAGGTADAASLQPIGTFGGAIYLTSDPANPERLFIVDRGGEIVQFENGTTTIVADFRSRVDGEGEGGLLSMALAPDFDRSGRLYVDYTTEGPGEIHVAELRIAGGVAPIGTLRDLLTIPHPETTSHFGGQLQFGPDGYLYVSTGDGGGENDPSHNAQSLGSLLGKVLRIDPDPGGSLPYTVPSGNPFTAQPAPFDTIWSYGLRNPFRFSFDRLSGDLLIGDVGQSALEEADLAPAAAGGGGGDNFGWSCREGSGAGLGDDPACTGADPGDFVEPVFDYPHTAHGGGEPPCAIVGGYVVRDPGLPGLYGRYLYGDYCSGELRSFDPADPYGSDRSEGLQVDELDSFGEDSCGRLYAVSRNGHVSRLFGTAPRSCALPPPLSPLPAVAPPSPHAPSYLGVRAISRTVQRGGRATITAFVSPCESRRGEAVNLWRGGQRLGTRHLDRVCTVRFRPRIRRRSVFRATISEDSGYLAATSRPLGIRPRAHRPQ